MLMLHVNIFGCFRAIGAVSTWFVYKGANFVNSVLVAVKLREFRRAPAQNKIGMVAWKMRMRTPEYPQVRTHMPIRNAFRGRRLKVSTP